MLVQYPGEQQMEPLALLCNTEQGGVFSNVRANLARGYDKFSEKKPHGRTIALCGSGPSLADTLESIRAMQKRGAFILALNGAAKFLSENGVPVDAVAMVDPRPDNVDFAEQAWAKEAWLASQCHPDVTAQCEKVGMRVVLWHPGVPEIQNHIPSHDSLRMGGGYTIGMCSLSCAYVAGFRELHLFGYDSSYREDKSHAFRQDRNANDELMLCTIESRQFHCSVVMAGQLNLFLDFSKHLIKDGCEIHVHGDGALPYLWETEQKKKRLRVLTACYDLGVSPPTFDFISFLAEAERYRVDNNFDVIDVKFQPGPMHGFRADNLPPDVPTRQAMLWRVCVPLARLLPSVRSVEVLGVRTAVAGHVFPLGWENEKPVAHYGIKFQRDATPIFKASDYAKKWASRFGSKYATITMRMAPHWPQRNSNIEAWTKVAQWLSDQGIKPIFIPDAFTAWSSGFTDCPEASHDLDLRAALYEGAVINLGVANGPIWIAPYLEARYLVFNICVESALSSSTQFLLAHGVAKGDQTVFGGNGRVIWEKDELKAILRELQEFDTQRTEENVYEEKA